MFLYDPKYPKGTTQGLYFGWWHTYYFKAQIETITPLQENNTLFFFFFFVFLGPNPRHVEVPRLGVQLKLQPSAYTRATAMQDPSQVCDLHHSQVCNLHHTNAGSLTHWARPGITPASSWMLAGSLTTKPRQELLHLLLKENWKYTLPLWPRVLPIDQIYTVTATWTHEKKPLKNSRGRMVIIISKHN